MKKAHQKKREQSVPVISPRQRQYFIAGTLALPLILLLIVEISLRIFQYGSDRDLIKSIDRNGSQYYYINPTVGMRYFNPDKYFLSKVNSGYFAVKKSSEMIRIFVLGESTPAGFPYQYNAIPTRILQKQLEILFPEKIIEVVNVGLTATNSYTVLEFIGELVDYQPDAIIVYSGQNEFYGALGSASTNSVSGQRWMIRLYQSLTRFRTFILLEQAINSVAASLASSSTAYSGTLMQQLAGDKAISIGSQIYRDALSSFDQNLSETAGIANQHNIPIIFSTMVTNEGSLLPFVSLHSESLTHDEQKNMESELSESLRLVQEGKYTEAMTLQRRIVSLDSSWAIAHFRLGESYVRAALVDSARTAFGKARDYDGLRFRASAEQNMIIRNLAHRHTAVIADAESTFRAHSPYGIIGSSLLWEHVHPRFGGYVMLSQSWLKALLTPSFLKVNKHMPISDTIDDAVLTDHLKITALDLEIGAMTMEGLLRRWPFSNEPVKELTPKNPVQQVALQFVSGKLRWNEAHFVMAESYLQVGDIENAIHEYTAVIAMDSTDSHPYVRTGDLYSAVGENDLALSAYRRSLELQENVLIRLKLGIIYMKKQKYADALPELSKSMNKGVSTAGSLTAEQYGDAEFYRAVALFKTGKTGEAAGIVTVMLAINPENERAARLMKEIGESPK